MRPLDELTNAEGSGATSRFLAAPKLSRTSSAASSTPGNSQADFVEDQIRAVDINSFELPCAAPSPAPMSTQPLSSDTLSGKRKLTDSDISSGSTESVLKRTKSDEGPSENPVLIAHSDLHQKIFDKNQLSLGVQWEIARLISSGRISYDNIERRKLDMLRGTNSQMAPQVEAILLDKDTAPRAFQALHEKELSSKRPWECLDWEENADNAALLGTDSQKSDFYGGQVHFVLKVKDLWVASDGKKPSRPSDWRPGAVRFAYEALPAERGSSDRFKRMWGSAALLRVHCDFNMTNELLGFLSEPAILNGGVFRAFRRKDENVFFVRTNEVYVNGRVRETDEHGQPGSRRMPSFLDFIDDHNPMFLNRNQPTAKWAARFDLPLSNSVPGCLIASEDILPEIDITSEQFTGSGKVPSELDMTDGCGFANRAALDAIGHRWNGGIAPTAIQMRVGGCKGLLLLHPDPEENRKDTPRIWIRPSQRKIKYVEGAPSPPAKRIVELLRCSSLKYPSRLSTETIINLGENGVHHKLLVDMVEDGIKELVTKLTTFETQADLISLRDFIARRNGVMAARRAREDVGAARARGYVSRDQKSDVADIDDDDLDPQDGYSSGIQSTAWWPDRVGGQPSSLEETVIELLDSGFRPMDCAVLRAKLLRVARTLIESYNKPPRYRVEVPMSCVAFLVPDPCGILAEGEIFCRSSHKMQVQDGTDRDCVEGDVLVTRHPCKLPTDVQKVKAVYKHELRNFTDVIIFSTKGRVSLASKLSGGDYDGDTGLLIWQPKLVDAFQNAHPGLSIEPPSVADSLRKDIEQVSDFLLRVPSTVSKVARIHELQKILLGGVYDQTLVGKYSTWHMYASFELGHADLETLRLGHIFCKLLDGLKTGVTVTAGAYAKDDARWNKRSPSWMESKEARERREKAAAQNNVAPPRPPKRRLPTAYIMDNVSSCIAGQVKRALEEVKAALPTGSATKDSCLEAPYLEAERLAIARSIAGCELALLELGEIKKHVELVSKNHDKRIDSGFTQLPIEKRQDVLRRLSEEFTVHSLRNTLAKGDGPVREILQSDADIARIMASYAYFYDYNNTSRRWTRFPWDVAFTELCTIKARSLGAKPVVRPMYESFEVHRSFRQ